MAQYCSICGKKLNLFNKKENFSDLYCKQCFKNMQSKVVRRHENGRSISCTQIIDTYNNSANKTLTNGVGGFIVAGTLGSYIAMLNTKGETFVTFIITYASGFKESKTVKIESSEYKYLIQFLK